MRFAIIAATSLVAAACSDSTPARDVQHFLDNPEELEQVFKNCRENPSRVGEPPECVNVREAFLRQQDERTGRVADSGL